MILSSVIGIIADDLTGANDTALQFFLKGSNTEILLGYYDELQNHVNVGTWAVSTETRNIEANDAAKFVYQTVLALRENLNVEQARTLLNKKSGLLGVSGVSSDARDIEDAIAAGNPRAIKAYDMFAARVADFIGQYFVQLGGCDAIVFTAGLGENGPEMREMTVNLIKDALGIELDAELNNCRGKQRLISTANSKVNLYIIPTNEELAIAQDVVRLLGL